MNEPSTSPYQAPQSDLSTPYDDNQVQAVTRFSAHGRIGRVRYVAYQTAYTLLSYLIFGLVGAATFFIGGGAVGVISAIVFGIVYIAIIVLFVLLTIQRCHDMDKSGWFSFLILIPLLGFLFFIFAPGTNGTNQFGPRTPPNTIGPIILAWIMPLLFILGILAAIAIPAYSTYVEQARQAQISQ